ncbi:MAG TPA: sigma-70 family RNA polymerase sigma factor [Candidatus Latescibacteria bacterium]|nr:sigma-70 family RNA polymerase sigma factor [Candidatus Latescibacterota bacterium]
MDHDPDISLVRRFKEGDEKAFDHIVRRYQDRLYHVALRMVSDHDDAIDITQDAFIKAYKGLRRFREDSSLYTWLYRIVVNLSINHQRIHRLRRFVSFKDVKSSLLSTKDSPDEITEGADLGRAVDEAIESLPEKQKAVFILRYYQGLSHREISEVLGSSIGTVKANYFHALKKLRKRLKEFR